MSDIFDKPSDGGEITGGSGTNNKLPNKGIKKLLIAVGIIILVTVILIILT